MSISSEVRTKLQNLVTSFMENHTVKPRGTTSFVIDGVQTRPTSIYNKVIEGDLKKLKDFDLMEDYFDWDASTKVEIGETLDSIIRDKYEENRRSKLSPSAIPYTHISFENYQLFMDIKTGSSVVVHSETGEVSPIGATVWKECTSKETKEMLPPKVGYLVFNPYESNLYKEGDLYGQPIQYLNLYIPPKWMKEDGRGIVLTDSDIDELTCPEIVMDFMSHLFPDEKCRDFVFSWMHHALVKRAETYLVLNGKKGAGKGLFCEVLLMNLMGENNYRIAPESILDSIFNSALDKTRMLVMDEIKVDSLKHLNRLKKYINNKQNIEKKGIDADTVVETFSSNVISNNSITDMMLEYDERRFSVPEITETPLLKSWGQAKINEFMAAMGDPDIQRQFGFWVLYKAKGEGSTPFSVWKGTRFNRIVYVSLAEWKKTIVDAVLSREHSEISIKDLRKMYKSRVESTNVRFPSNIPRIASFVENYLHEGKHSLGEVVYEEGEHFIIPSDMYMPETNDSSSDPLDML